MKKQSIPRYAQILLMFACTSLPLIIYGVVQVNKFESSSAIIEKILATNGFWTFITVAISSPIAFLVWKFRDENTAHQLENQRKDVNLKEFQKIAEWVSGLYLVEDKIVEKTKHMDKPAGDNPSDQKESLEAKTDKTPETEITHEYGQVGQSRHILSHSRQDGAVGLQVAAVYMLKPFYCGEHGDSFRKPALNLLTSAWLALFKQLERDKEDLNVHRKLDPKALSNSSLAIALTEVLLADGGIHLRGHTEIFPNLYLPYLNLHLPGLDKGKVLQVFTKLDCSGINLEYANLAYVKLDNAELKNAKLNLAKLRRAELNGAKLYGTELKKAVLTEAVLTKAKLKYAKLTGADLYDAKLTGADLDGADLDGANLDGANLDGANLKGAVLNRAKLYGAKLTGTVLNEAELNHAVLTEAVLTKANLSGADLWGADLTQADLTGAKLFGADLRRADLNEAKLNEAELDDANLYLAAISDIKIDNQTSLRGTVFDTENIEEIRSYLDEQGLKWVILAPKFPSDTYTDFIFEKEGYECIHKLPDSLAIEALQELNPSWVISYEDESNRTFL